MENNLYNNAALFGHIHSKQPLAEGQLFLDQMNSKAGHVVYDTDIRGQAIPVIMSIQARDVQGVFLVNETSSNRRIVGGSIGSRYNGIMQFIDKVKIKKINGTNDQSYQIVDKDQNVVSNLIMPTDVPISTTKMSDGYEVKLYSEDGLTQISTALGWSVNQLNGIIHFSSQMNPSSAKWIQLGFGTPRVECFYYVGKSVNDKIKNVNDNLTSLTSGVQIMDSSLITIQPFKFCTDPLSGQMETISACFKRPFAYPQLSQLDLQFQTFSCIIPGYVFEVISCQTGATINCKILHLTTGDSQISIDLPWNPQRTSPMPGWQFDQELLARNPSSIDTSKITQYSFLASSFIRKNGLRLVINKPIEIETAGDLINVKTKYLLEGQNTWCLPDECICSLTENEAINKYDQSVNINVNLTDV